MAKDNRRKGRPESRTDDEHLERRKGDRRRDARVPVDIWVEEYEGDDLYFQQAGNLSIGGVFFERTIPHPIGTRVRLRFTLPGSEGVIETAGEVVSIPDDEETGAGIRFVDLDPVEEKLIREYVKELIEG